MSIVNLLLSLLVWGGGWQLSSGFSSSGRPHFVRQHVGQHHSSSTTSKLLVHPPFITTPTPPSASNRLSSKEIPSRSKSLVNTPRTSPPSALCLSSDPSNGSSSSKTQVPFWLDPGTKGGVIVYTILLFVVPILLYNFVVSAGIADEISAGRTIGIGFTVVLSLAWVSTYVFRVATKDMTYAKQLKDYENAVIAKRLEELDEDEIQALVEEVERDDF